MEFDGFAEGVCPGEERQGAVGFVDFKRCDRNPAVHDDIFMGELDASRPSRGAARVDDVGQVVLADLRIEVEHVLLGLDEGFETLRIFGVRGVNAIDFLKRRAVQAFDFFADRLVGHDGEGWEGVRKNELPVLNLLDLIHGNRDGAQPIRRIGGQRKFGRIACDDGHAISLLESVLFKECAQFAHFNVELRVRHPRVLAIFFDAQKRAFSMPLNGVSDEFGEGLKAPYFVICFFFHGYL